MKAIANITRNQTQLGQTIHPKMTGCSRACKSLAAPETFKTR